MRKKPSPEFLSTIAENTRWYKSIPERKAVRNELAMESAVILFIIFASLVAFWGLIDHQMTRQAKAEAYEDCIAKHMPKKVCKAAADES